MHVDSEYTVAEHSWPTTANLCMQRRVCARLKRGAVAFQVGILNFTIVHGRGDDFNVVVEILVPRCDLDVDVIGLCLAPGECKSDACSTLG